MIGLIALVIVLAAGAVGTSLNGIFTVAAGWFAGF